MVGVSIVAGSPFKCMVPICSPSPFKCIPHVRAHSPVHTCSYVCCILWASLDLSIALSSRFSSCRTSLDAGPDSRLAPLQADPGRIVPPPTVPLPPPDFDRSLTLSCRLLRRERAVFFSCWMGAVQR